jgi:hypothetical protein
MAQPSKSRPVIVSQSIIAGLQFIFAGLSANNLGEYSNKTLLAIGVFGMLLTTGVQVGIMFYVQNSVTPTEDVVAYRNRDNIIVAGAAATDPEKAAAAVEVLTTAPAGDGVTGQQGS